MAPIVFIRNSLVGAFVLLAIAGAIDYAVDPFQQYRVPTSYAPRFYRAYQRHENPCGGNRLSAPVLTEVPTATMTGKSRNA